MGLKTVVLVGSVRCDRQGIKAARFVERSLQTRGHEVSLVDPVELRPGRWSIHDVGEPRVRLPIEGTETVIVRGLPGGTARHVERAGLVYDRIVTADSVVERITVADPIVAREDALAFLAAIADAG